MHCYGSAAQYRGTGAILRVLSPGSEWVVIMTGRVIKGGVAKCMYILRMFADGGGVIEPTMSARLESTRRLTAC